MYPIVDTVQRYVVVWEYSSGVMGGTVVICSWILSLKTQEGIPKVHQQDVSSVATNWLAVNLKLFIQCISNLMYLFFFETNQIHT